MYKAKFNIEEILNITKGTLLNGKKVPGDFSISTDTRAIKPEEIYLPLTGENFDGHNFIDVAIDKSCRGYFLDEKHLTADYKKAKLSILVKNTQVAYLELANACRTKIKPIVIAVTGSSGKTTTKEMLFSVFSKHFKTHKSILNHNNEIGLCQTLMSMKPDTEVLIVEMGMRGLGEIEILSKYAEPDLAIITNIGSAHIGRLGSVENIAKAKCEIVKHLHSEGVLISPKDELVTKIIDQKIDSIFYNLTSDVKILNQSEKGSEFIYKGNEYKLKQPGEYNISNAIAVIEAALKCGIHPEKIKEGLIEYKNAELRQELIELPNNITLINDCYNANPESVEASVKAISTAYKNKYLTVVMGDMLELGELEKYYHKQVGEFISNLNINNFVTVGSLAKLAAESVTNNNIEVNSFDDINEAAEYLKMNLNSDSVILLKASRGMEFEKIIERIKE